MKSRKMSAVIPAAVLVIIAICTVYAVASHHHSSVMHGSGSQAASVYNDTSISSDFSVPGNSHTMKNISYGDRSCEYFDLFIPENVDAEHAPLILFVHGGGWRYGECEDFLPQCREYAEKGFVTATINYSVLSDDTPEVTFDFMMNEFTDCIAKIDEVCTENDINLSGMALYGYSAGAHLALLYGYSMDDVSPVPIKTVFALAPPTDFNLSTWTKSNYWESTNEIADIISMALGKRINKNYILNNPDFSEEISVLSPISFIDKDTVPTVLAHGKLDTTVPVIHSELAAENLQKYGISYRFIVFEHSTHLLENDPDAMEEFNAAVDEFAYEYLVKDIGQNEGIGK